MNKSERIKELCRILNKASEAYYAKDEEIMSNFEYDSLYDELVSLEEETGIVLSDSPTRKVGYEPVSFLPKFTHPSPMLSLSKTKDRDELVSWLGDKKGLLSWKLDGLTVVLTYENGVISNAVTRGNGEEGEVITQNAECFKNLPVKISFKGRLVIRGEAVISYSDFEKINEKIKDPAEQYKNPRNLCSGSVRQLDPNITAKRNVCFFAFSLVEAEGADFNNSRLEQMKFLNGLGFEIVHEEEVDKDNLKDKIEWYANEIKTYDIPSDGLVLMYDDIAYGNSLGTTAKAPRNAIAFKWQDEQAETVLRKIEWSPSRTGLINPVAIFDSVDLEGTSVSRASVHNISDMRSLKLGIGDRILVYKANMIIPQISANLTGSNNVEIPEICPVCGMKTMVESTDGTDVLMCKNELCPVKQEKALALFASRNAMNIDGVSEETIVKFIEKGFIKEYADFFKLEQYKNDIVTMEGFGIKSYENIIASCNNAKKTTLPRLLYGLGIENVGVANAKLIASFYDYDFDRIRNADVEELSTIDQVGEVIATSIYKFFHNESRSKEIDSLLECIELEKIQNDGNRDLLGKTFVITGSLNRFENRDALKDIIEQRGGKVAGSVSAKTEALINNDVNSTSGKNKKAKELGIRIISEEDFLEEFNIIV
ncbi:MAG: NAD-dependent DNA ligase LigA [Lachnospiraceae bacterium]|nr:NAD-dependent DNA ligase LigA [Lachnospiraceae bacterium]